MTFGPVPSPWLLTPSDSPEQRVPTGGQPWAATPEMELDARETVARKVFPVSCEPCWQILKHRQGLTGTPIYSQLEKWWNQAGVVSETSPVVAYDNQGQAGQSTLNWTGLRIPAGVRTDWCPEKPTGLESEVLSVGIAQTCLFGLPFPPPIRASVGLKATRPFQSSSDPQNCWLKGFQS